MNTKINEISPLQGREAKLAEILCQELVEQDKQYKVYGEDQPTDSYAGVFKHDKLDYWLILYLDDDIMLTYMLPQRHYDEQDIGEIIYEKLDL